MTRQIGGYCPKCHEYRSFEVSDWLLKEGRIFTESCPCGATINITVHIEHHEFVANIEAVEGERN